MAIIKNDKIETRNSKVNLHEVMEVAKIGFHYIQSWGNDKEPSKPDDYEDNHGRKIAHMKRGKYTRIGDKNKALRLFANKIKTYLHGNKKDMGDDVKITLSTYAAYLSDIRDELQHSLNVKNPYLEDNIEKLISKYPSFKDELNKILSSDAADVGYVLNVCKDKLKTDPHKEAVGLRQDLRKLKVHHPFIESIKLSDTDRETRQDRLETNNKRRRNNNIVVMYPNIMELANECLDSDDFYELVIGVAIATGRRAIEVIHTGTFDTIQSFKGNIKGILWDFQGFQDESRDFKETDVIFSGVAKHQKHRDGVYLIPTLYDASIITDAVKRLRATDIYLNNYAVVKDMALREQNEVINRRTAPPLNNLLRELLPIKENEVTALTFKALRGMASSIAAEKLKDERFGSIDSHLGYSSDLAFKSAYLIHDTPAMIVNYDYVKVIFDGEALPKPKIEPKERKQRGADFVPDADISALKDVETQLAELNEKGLLSLRKLHLRVIETITEHGGFTLSYASIYNGKKYGDKKAKIGGGVKLIKRYLEKDIVKAGIQQFHKDNGLNPPKESNKGATGHKK